MNVLKRLLPLFAVAMLLIWSGCKKDSGDNTLKADFTYELTGNPGEVTFTNQSRNAQTYEWNFGDGSQSTVTSPTHTYDQNGDFIVHLKAFGPGETNAVTDTLTINNIP